ncbi:MAG: RidA family protein [Chloroflexi bacterium]|jgi:enamine deaminase RidA (YjgF/YER057c/UK114 family)|nr:RidA family protein [Chloroflexota bacterium]
MNIYQRMKELGIVIPELPRPVASYQPAVVHQNIVYASGQTGTVHQKLVYTGKLGAEVGLEDGKKSARLAALNCLAELQAVLIDLNRVERILRVTGYVASAPGFNDQPQVVEGASVLLIEVFGEHGRHARSAIGVAELPSNAPVEIELLAAISR